MAACQQTHDDDEIEVSPELLEELLIYGYIRDIQIDFDSVSRDIIDLCTKWFGTYLNSAQFVFDSFGVDASRMQIINARTVKCLETGNYQIGGSLRLKCALPTKSNANGVRSVFWECVPNKLRNGWNNVFVSFGVVSNRTNSFVNAFNGLKDAYGVSLNHSGFVYKGNPQNKTSMASVYDDGATALMDSFARGSKIGIEYVVAESKLNFYRDDETEPEYAMDLPTNVSGITHWYPYVSLYDKDDECTISENVRIN